MELRTLRSIALLLALLPFATAGISLPGPPVATAAPVAPPPWQLTPTPTLAGPLPGPLTPSPTPAALLPEPLAPSPTLAVPLPEPPAPSPTLVAPLPVPSMATPTSAAGPNPADGAADQPYSILNLSWIANASTFTVYLKAGAFPDLDDTVCVNVDQPRCTVGNLNPGTTYYWFVDACDGTTCARSAIWSFTTTSGAPVPATGPNPADGATGVQLSPQLSWEGGVDPNGYQQLYTVFLDANLGPTNPKPTDPLAGANCQNTVYTNACQPEQPLLPGTVYYWRVVSDDQHGSQVTSAVWRFTTTSGAPVPATGPNPADGATGVQLSPQLSWEGGVDPNGYQQLYTVFLDANLDPANPHPTTPLAGANCQNTGYTNACQPEQPLQPGTVYYWRVVSDDQHGSQVTSAVWRFTTLEPNPPMAVSVDTVYTLDASWHPRTAFSPGDTIRFGLNVTNPAASSQPASWSWLTYDANGVEVGSLSYENYGSNVGPGAQNLAWSATIPGDQPPGSYTYIGKICVGFACDSKQATFTVGPPSPPPVACHALTLAHTGQGSDPSASPASSSGCPAGEYAAGDAVQLTASPAPGWQVSAWHGTTNDSSSALQNSLIMPAADVAVTVDYILPVPPPPAAVRVDMVYTLDANWHPRTAFSPGDIIRFGLNVTNPGATSQPASWSWLTYDANGVEVGSLSYENYGSNVGPGAQNLAWSATIPGDQTPGSYTYIGKICVGSACDSKQATFTVGPPSPPPVACHALTLAHTGQGSDPSASPASSSGCPAGEYAAGEAVQLTASPAPGWQVAGWTGTENDRSTALQNSVTVPGGETAVAVSYAQTSATGCGAAQRIQFAPGGTAATVQVTDAATSSNCWVLSAEAGQTMSALLTSADGPAILVVRGADGTVLQSDHAASPAFEGSLPGTQDYYLQVDVWQGTSTYTLVVTILPARGRRRPLPWGYEYGQ